MAVSKQGIMNYCDIVSRPPTSTAHPASNTDIGESELTDTHGDNDGDWMLSDAWQKRDEIEEGARGVDLHSIIRGITEQKRVQLEGENELLDSMFTDKDQRELEKFRAIKEDMDMDDLQVLKELRLKRKLKLLRELRELKDLHAENHLKRDDNETKCPAPAVVTGNSSESRRGSTVSLGPDETYGHPEYPISKRSHDENIGSYYNQSIPLEADLDYDRTEYPINRCSHDENTGSICNLTTPQKADLDYNETAIKTPTRNNDSEQNSVVVVGEAARATNSLLTTEHSTTNKKHHRRTHQHKHTHKPNTNTTTTNTTDLNIISK